MKKILFMTLSILSVFWFVCLFSYNRDTLANALRVPEANAATQTVTLSVTVTSFLSFTTNSGGTIDLGLLNPGTPVCNTSGTVFLVNTNASNGYKMTPADGSNTDSTLTHVDATTKIKDYLGTLATPTTWTGSGLGVTLWSGVQREAAWSVGGVALNPCTAASNKYAGVPTDTSTTGHTVAGFLAGPDTTYWGWKIDVPNTQKTGAYTGAVTFTAIPILL